MNTLTKLRIRRYINRRSNSVVEQIERVLARLQSFINKLDQEQDAANEAMKTELASLKESAEAEIERMQNALEERKAEQAAEAEKTKAGFMEIINESSAEARKARAVQSNFKALTAETTD